MLKTNYLYNFEFDVFLYFRFYSTSNVSPQANPIKIKCTSTTIIDI